MDPFVKYLNEGVLSDKSPSKIGKFKRKASQFVLLDGQLYKKSFSFSLLKCPLPIEADYIL